MSKITFTSSSRVYKWGGGCSDWFESKELFGTIITGDVRIILGRMFYAKISLVYNKGVYKHRISGHSKRYRKILIPVGWLPVTNDMIFEDLKSNREGFFKKIIDQLF